MDVTQLEKMRQEREINKQTMATLVGYQRLSGWTHAIENGGMAPAKRRLAKDAFDYYDSHGYVPEPREINTHVQ